MPEATTRFIRDIPLDKITIQKLQNIYSTTIRFNDCRLRLNPHHTGYTYFNLAGIKYGAHRIVKTAAAGVNAAPGMVVDHLCRNRSCVRLSHLEFVTEAENVRRGTAADHFKARRFSSHCKNGHEFNELNTRYKPSVTGVAYRQCRVCGRLRTRARRQYVKEVR